jgi:tetratricopeptide (TPR) repeat protein
MTPSDLSLGDWHAPSPAEDSGPLPVGQPRVDRAGDEAAAEHFLRAYTTYARAGKREAALQAASDACYAAPHLAAPHYAYGESWLAMNEAARAEQAFAAALQINPSWADAWINYGLARYRQGAVEDAKTAMRQALRFAPNHPAAIGNLGAFMRITGEAESAEALLRATLQADPGNAGARLNLAADLLQEERAGDALVLLEAGDPPKDNIKALRHWYLQTALALLQLRRPAEARPVLEKLAALGIPPEIAPLWHWRQTLLGLGEGSISDARAAAELMAAALTNMGPEAVLEHQIMARYDLAKFWSGQGEHARAFGQWQAGHELLRRIQPFSRTDHLAFIEANIACFHRDRFAQGPVAANNDPAPVFIVGMPRSGTTLCERILAAHGAVHGAGERGALGHTFGRLAGTLDSAAGVQRVASLDTETLDAAAAAYLAELHALAPDKSRIVDKMPGNYLSLGLVGLMLPGAKIIYCARDPRDIGLSIFTFRFHGSHGYAHDLGDLGWTIAQSARLMAHWQNVLPNPVLTVRLADWVEDFNGTLARVLAHLDLPYDAACERFYDTEARVRTVSRTQVRQPVNASGLGRWRTYEPQLAPLIAELEAGGAL